MSPRRHLLKWIPGSLLLLSLCVYGAMQFKQDRAPGAEVIEPPAAHAVVDEMVEATARTGTIESCAACHGQSGQGMREMLAPSLAGMPEWYLNEQMSMFIDGRRKATPEGGFGDEMVRLLKDTDPAELRRFAKHYSSLTPIKIKSELGGDPWNGQVIYQGRGACINCHLQTGKGDGVSGAPPITIIPEWYFLRQMRAFREGDRGGHSEDELIQCMVVAASRLDEKECRDVAAYLEKLVGN